MKLYAYITDPEDFLNGEYNWCFGLSAKPEISAWLRAGEIEVEFDLDEKQVRQIAVEQINAEMQVRRDDFTRGMGELEQRKQELLSITHQPEEQNGK